MRGYTRGAMSKRTIRATCPEDDPSFYPEEEKLGEGLLQRKIVELLRPLLERWLAERGVVALTGADQFMYFRRGDVRTRVSPDVYVIPGVPPERMIRSWLTWLEGKVPSFALEVVSRGTKKDYKRMPPLYDELGVKELVIFDPEFHKRANRVRFQIYRRQGRRWTLQVTNEDRVRSRELGCWLRVVGEGAAQRLRIATGPAGEALFATEAEHERAMRESAGHERERERAEKERERAARQAAETELARLRAELARAKRPRKKRQLKR